MEPAPCAIIILGASGDLVRRKLIPALYALFRARQLGPGCIIVGSGRSEFDDRSFGQRFAVDAEFRQRLFYHRTIPGLKSFVASHGTFARTIVFFALPPHAYVPTARELAAEGFGPECSVVLEKPIGYDCDTARELNRAMAAYFSEAQIFRIDHYLAKEAVQNILVFRFANSLWYPVWNSRYIESIQINAFETEGVQARAAYFDRAGIVRDMVQNHLLQLLCLITMEAPVSLTAADIRAQKLNVLRCLSVKQCFKGQYEGYTAETGIDPHSATETFAELELAIDDFRWSGTPIYLRAGKALDRRGTEIGIRFRPLPHLLFNEHGAIPPNRIIFKIQPAEGILIDLASKVPGDSDHIVVGTTMRFCYRDSFEGEIPEAYQKLLHDVIRNDQSLFVSAEETECAWRVLGPILGTKPTETYGKGVVPRTRLGTEWIDFRKYGTACA